MFFLEQAIVSVCSLSLWALISLSSSLFGNATLYLFYSFFPLLHVTEMKPPPAGIIVLVQMSTDSFDKRIHVQYYVQTVVSKWVHIGVTVYPGASLNTKFVILWKCIKLTCFNMRERSTEVANGRFKNSSGTLLAICNFWSLWLLNMAQCTTDNRHYLLIKN